MTILFIPGVLAFFALGLAWAAFNSNIHLLLKVGLSIIFVGVSIISVYAIPSFMGYPSLSSFSKLNLVDAVIDQEDNAIFLWGNESEVKGNVFKYNDHSAPRAYEIPYTKENEKKISEAKAKVKSGYKVVLSSGLSSSNDAAKGSEGNQNSPHDKKGNSSIAGNSDGNEKGLHVEVIDPRVEIPKEQE